MSERCVSFEDKDVGVLIKVEENRNTVLRRTEFGLELVKLKSSKKMESPALKKNLLGGNCISYSGLNKE